MAQELSETEVWEAFRALRRDGRAIYEAMCTYFESSRFFDAPGDTLEIGGGDGHLWEIGGEALLARATAAGTLVITDGEAALVERCREMPRFRRGGVVVAQADVTALPFADRRFARILVTHVLHWCVTPERIRRAVAELSRVLQPEGRALIITVDENVHMIEVYALLRRAREILKLRCIDVMEMPVQAPRILPFCSGNAPTYLAEAFGTVGRVDVDYTHFVDATHPTLGISGAGFMARYLRTLPFLKQASPLPPEFFETVRTLVEEELARGPFHMSRRDVIYDCARPR